MRFLLLLTLVLATFGPAPTQAAARASAAQTPEVSQGPSQRYRSIALRMSKDDVRRVMGKPNQSTDTVWLYTYADETTVEVIFSKERRVTQVLHYKKQRQFPRKR